MSLRDDVDLMIDRIYADVNAEVDKHNKNRSPMDPRRMGKRRPWFLELVGEGVETYFDNLVQDEAVIRETQWEVLQETNAQVSWDEVVAVLEAFNRVLKGGLRDDGGEDANEDSSTSFASGEEISNANGNQEGRRQENGGPGQEGPGQESSRQEDGSQEDHDQASV